MRTLITTQDKDIKRIDIVDISTLVVIPEECSGDDKYNTMRKWSLHANLNVGRMVKLFEAKEFDTNKKFFYAHQAVKGKNYQRVMEAKRRVEDVITKANADVVVIQL